VGLRATETDAVITVRDTGCGISESDLERVVLPFVQVGSTLSRKFGGNELGLSIARELCSLHGGRLDIDSVEGQGTTVRISLRLANSAAL
jgi:two-component system cell cycle sensor histidine kinase PleC